MFIETQPDVLEKLQDLALIQSTDSSNKIEGIFTSNKRLRELVAEKITYYDVLQESSVGWADNAQDYLPFVQYLLGIILKAYREFEKRFNITHKTKMSSKERVLEIINHALVPLSKADIVILSPELSQKTIERRLTELVKETEIKKIGSGRSTVYSSIK